MLSSCVSGPLTLCYEGLQGLTQPLNIQRWPLLIAFEPFLPVWLGMLGGQRPRFLSPGMSHLAERPGLRWGSW